MDPQLQARLYELRKELAEVDAKIAELNQYPTSFDLKNEILNMSDTKEWKDFVNNGVVDNITAILDDSYDSFIDCIEGEFPNIKPTDFIGEFGSSKWLRFKLETIKKLLNPSDLNEDFSDTAGGCDENAWNTGFYIIQKMVLQM